MHHPMQKKSRTPMKCSVLILVVLASVAATSTMVAQESGSSASAQQGSDAGANTIYKIDGDVSAPVLIHSVVPEYTEAARNANISGTVLIALYVDVNGNPSHIHVLHGLGVGLDLNALICSTPVQIQARNEGWSAGSSRAEC
jgi:hypothetical protein